MEPSPPPCFIFLNWFTRNWFISPPSKSPSHHILDNIEFYQFLKSLPISVGKLVISWCQRIFVLFVRRVNQLPTWFLGSASAATPPAGTHVAQDGLGIAVYCGWTWTVDAGWLRLLTAGMTGVHYCEHGLWFCRRPSCLCWGVLHPREFVVISTAPWFSTESMLFSHAGGEFVR